MRLGSTIIVYIYIYRIKRIKNVKNCNTSFTLKGRVWRSPLSVKLELQFLTFFILFILFILQSYNIYICIYIQYIQYIYNIINQRASSGHQFQGIRIQHQIGMIKTLFLRFGHCSSSECSKGQCPKRKNKGFIIPIFFQFRQVRSLMYKLNRHWICLTFN